MRGKKNLTGYKNIWVHDIEEISALEFSLYHNRVNCNRDFIEKITEFAEYVGYQKPQWVIINLQDAEYKVEKNVCTFFNEVILKQIMHSIQKIYLLSDHQCLNGEAPEGVYLCSNYEEIKKNIAI